ncbi:hypothetical protein GQ457_02G018480 [Hibiscus cannabinus]
MRNAAIDPPLVAFHLKNAGSWYNYPLEIPKSNFPLPIPLPLPLPLRPEPSLPHAGPAEAVEADRPTDVIEADRPVNGCCRCCLRPSRRRSAVQHPFYSEIQRLETLTLRVYTPLTTK